jgi:hypothetical protein
VAVTTQIVNHTPLTAAFGGSMLTANKKRLFAKWVERKEVRKTPVTDWMKRRSGGYDQMEIETGQSYAPFITTTLGAQAGASTAGFTVASTTYLREGDVLKVTPYYSGSTTELDYANAEYSTINGITSSTVITTLRDQGQSNSGSWPTHASGSEVRVISRAQNYLEPFPDAISYKGDSISQYIQSFDSGELTYATQATKVGDYESDNHMLKDIMVWKDILPKYREAAFIEGIRVAPDYDATPQVQGHLGGMIWWALQGTGNESAIDGQINAFTFDDILREKAELHSDGPGDTMFGGYKTIAALDTALNELKGNFGPDATTFTSKTTKLSYRWGDITPRPVHGWPEGKILITSKADWEWGHFEGHDWQFVERGPEELGMMAKSWTMTGDFSMTCLNLTRQILLTGIDTRLDLYPGRQIFVTA